MQINPNYMPMIGGALPNPNSNSGSIGNGWNIPRLPISISDQGSNSSPMVMGLLVDEPSLRGMLYPLPPPPPRPQPRPQSPYGGGINIQSLLQLLMQLIGLLQGQGSGYLGNPQHPIAVGLTPQPPIVNGLIAPYPPTTMGDYAGIAQRPPLVNGLWAAN